ncbi:MAG: type 1 glutamine amidotransferase [Chloroflexi bacterium]|nr:type 1 glutamine amidotransferase [Chloroflexota bacterium]
MKLDGKKIAILVEAGFEDSELIVPLEAMQKAGARVVVIGNDVKQIYQGKRGMAVIKADITADRAKAEQFDAIIIPGGYAPDRMRLHQSMISLVNRAHRLGKIIAAICHGPQLLISAGIVRGRRLTSWPSITIDLRNAGAHWVDEPVVIDRNIITSRKPADLPAFNKAIKEALTGVNGNNNGKTVSVAKGKVKVKR